MTARLNGLQLIDSLELAVISQKERLAQQRAELLSFELQQKSVDSQVAHENAMLNRYQDEYEQLNAPLIQTHQHRLAIEAQRMQHAGEQGVLPAPYQPISPQAVEDLEMLQVLGVEGDQASEYRDVTPER